MASTFTTQRSIARNIVLAAQIQETIGEVFTDAALTYLSRAETTGFAQLAYEKESDLQYSGKNGRSMATESRLIAQSSAFDYTARLDDFLVGYLFALVMGNETFSAGAAGPPQLPNTHLFTWRDTGDPANLTNVYIEDTAGLKRKWSDFGLSQVVLSGADKGSITSKSTFMGLGTVTADIAGKMAALPALPTAQYLYGSDSIVSLGPTGEPVSLAPRVLSWEATFDHALELFRAAGCGTKPYFVRQGNPINKLKLVIAVDTSTDVFDWMVNQTPLEVKIAVNSGATSLLIDYPNIILPKADLGEQDKYVAYTVDLDQQSILQPAGGGESVTVTVENTDVAYLLAA